MKKGELFIISAPSGAGKTSLVNAVLASLDDIQISISYTTRSPRAKEVNHRDYIFVSEADFLLYQRENKFLESAKVFNYYYGTSQAWVEEKLNEGIDVILEIDWQGAKIVKSLMPCISIFILPPSTQDLRKRLQGRNQDNIDVIEYRMKQAHDEMSHHANYDYLIINDDFECATLDLISIIKAERLKTAKQIEKNHLLISDLLA